MTTKLKWIAGVTGAALLSGCAGGGGSAGAVPDLIGALLCTPMMLPPDCGQRAQALNAAQASASAQNQSATLASSNPMNFTWSTQQKADGTVVASGIETISLYQGNPADRTLQLSSDPMYSDGVSAELYFQRSAEKSILSSFRNAHVDVRGAMGEPGTPTLSGQPAIEIFRHYDGTNAYFSDSSYGNIGLLANPYKLGWEYQSFGVWHSQFARDLPPTVGAMSYGSATLASAIPTTGTASFTGKLGGLYISAAGQGSMAAADVTVNADFGRRSLGFASGNTILARDASIATTASHLNLSGTLSYSPAANAFTGTLTNAGGTMSGTTNGRFYGPAAQELGGVFAIKSPTTVESLVGAYGAKR